MGGTPDEPEREEIEDVTAKDVEAEDSDRKAILQRRNRFIALALSGLTSAGVGGCYESHGTGTPPPRIDSGTVPDTGPSVCLGAPLDAGPGPCLGVALDAGPRPCLEPPADAGPTPCLDVAPADAGPDATVTPGPCLSAPIDPDAGTD